MTGYVLEPVAMVARHQTPVLLAAFTICLLPAITPKSISLFIGKAKVS
jgi:hypothetical protein